MSYAARVWNDNWMNFSVLRHGAFDGFLVTSKNSGTHWMMYMFAVALADYSRRERRFGLREAPGLVAGGGVNA